MIEVLKALAKVKQVATHRHDGQLQLLEKSDGRFRALGAPMYIGEFDKYSPPFTYVSTAHGIETPENYAIIAPMVKCRVFYERTVPAVDYLEVLTDFEDVTDVTVIFHDWLSTHDEPIYKTLYQELSQWRKATHLPMMVDWRNGSQARADIGSRTTNAPNRWYNEAALNSAVVGREIGRVLAHKPKLTNIHLIGVGLGGHAAYFAADWYHVSTGRRRHVRRLTAIDPSYHAFLGRFHVELHQSYKYLAAFRTVADEVDVIHASVYQSRQNGYSSNDDRGTVDFFIDPLYQRDRDMKILGSNRLSQGLCNAYVAFLGGKPKVHCSTEAAVQAYAVSVEAARRSGSTPAVTGQRCDDLVRKRWCAVSREAYKDYEESPSVRPYLVLVCRRTPITENTSRKYHR